ncbi:outer membrane lipoprotein-sorting protein [candidate division KSB1 bacterium]|nr:outer membrane lipoprotein-sorting protein [candidate division KSB1 bacterium]RQW03973.1 MAG: outer membrane lipoprotein-sorting protein [candidate division KSB1 bacterium]
MSSFAIKASLLMVLTLALALFPQEDPQQIMRKSYDAMTLAGSESISTLTISDGKGNQRLRKFSSAQKTDQAEQVTKMVMRFLEPADVKGTGILTFDYESKDDDMWLYMPALRKVRRIVSSEKTKSFMGSEFSNADITKPSMSDYTYEMVGSDILGDVECWKIEMAPASKKIGDSYGYSKKIGWIGKTDYIARKTEYYDLHGELIKVMTADKVELLDEKNKKYQPVDITMSNKQNGRSSRIVIDRVQFSPNVKEEYFTTAYLEK